jgi:23S rRNA (adenine2503-C2)-methyltransferase
MEILGLEKDELTAELAALGQPAFRAGQVLDWIYAKRAPRFDAMSNLPAALRTALESRFILRPLSLVRRTGSKDTTQKFLFALPDGQMIETVLIPASPALYGEVSDRLTACVSSQVGCAYGCRFCASGLDGWKRHLSAAEIVSQVLSVEEISGQKINNIVFMGMGEPFANYDNLLRAIRILNAPWGVGLGARHMTVSTSGLAPRIRDFADQPLQIRLAISLHGATNEVRSEIMPVNKRFPVEELMEACHYFTGKKKQYLTFEYILIQGINDSPEQATTLARLASGLRAKINLIPYNKVEGLPWVRPDVPTQEAFLKILLDRGLAATLRREKGHDISAACGQLRLQTARQQGDDTAGKKLFALGQGAE